MNYYKLLLIALIALTSCRTASKEENKATHLPQTKSDFTITFGSCNNQNLPNVLWKEILKNNPDVWIWGGDVIYSDTEDIAYLKQNYAKQKSNVDYQNFIKNVEILATWDDHDYSKNDGGVNHTIKKASQQLFLDFIDVPKNSARRKQKGVYFSKNYTVNNTSIKIILLDTRYFRTELTHDTETKKRYKPNLYGQGTMLGETQWKWLKNELDNSKAQFNIIVSSIQFLSGEHGFECWSNMPHEIDKLETLLKTSGAKNTIILSGDRHISEISKKDIDSLSYPLIDFTSSGLTHSYTKYKGEPNVFRVGDVVFTKSFGILRFDLENNTVTMEIRGLNNKVYKTFSQKYN